MDGDSHGPMAEEMICHLCGDSPLRWQLAEQAAVRALEARIRLWDGVLTQIETCRATRAVKKVSEKPNDRFLEAAIRLGWIDGLSTDEISKQLQMSTEQIEAIVSGGGEIAG